MANQLRQSGRRPEEREEIMAERRFSTGSPAPGCVIAQLQMSLPIRARSRAKVRPPVSCFLAGSFLDARSGKYRQIVCKLLDPQTRGQRSRTLVFRAFAPAAPHRLAFFLRASGDPDSPRL